MALKPCKRILSRRMSKWDYSAQDKFIGDLKSSVRSIGAATVSIVMLAKDSEQCIIDAIHSVLNQTYPHLELIIVSEDCTDGIQSRISEVDDSRITHIFYSSKEPSSARNRGLAHANGDWVFFLDSDHIWSPDTIETMLYFVTHNDLRAAYCGARALSENGDTQFYLFTHFDFESCAREDLIDLNCFCVNRALKFIEFDESLYTLAVWHYIMRIAAITRVKGVPFIGVNYFDKAKNDYISDTKHDEHREFHDLEKRVHHDIWDAQENCPVFSCTSAHRIALVLHVYHQEVVDDCIRHLENISFPYDLFITTSLSQNSPAISKIASLFPHSVILHYPNYGSDVAPFLELCSTLKSYFVVCKIHTKRDLPELFGSLWRDLLIEPILGTSAHIEEIVKAFTQYENLNAIGSYILYKSAMKNSIPRTLLYTRIMAAKLQIDLSLLNDWGFFAGTMFWARPAVLLDLARRMSQSEGYSIRRRQDGGIEHALERLIGLSFWHRNGSLVGLASADTSELVIVDQSCYGEYFTLEIPQTLKKIKNTVP